MADTGVTIDDLKTELTAVRAAILASLKTGASVNRPGLGYSRVSFSELRAHEADLVRNINRSGEGIISVLDVSAAGGAGDTSWDGAGE